MISSRSKSPELGSGKKIGLNFLSQSYAQAVTLFVQLLVVPFFLRAWGVERYGDWLVLSGIPLLLTMLDLGITQASASRATMAGAAGRWDDAAVCLNTGQAFTLSVAALSLIVGLAANSLVSWDSLLHLKVISTSASREVIFSLGFYLAVHFCCGPLDAFFRVVDRAALGAFLLGNRRLLDAIITITVLSMGGGPVNVAVALSIGQVVALVAIYSVARRLSDRPLLGLKHRSLAELRDVYKPALAHASIPIAQAITLQGGVQAMNALAGSSAVVVFTMSRTFMRLIVQLGMVGSNALRPELSRLLGVHDYRRARSMTLHATVLLLGLGLLAYGAMCLLGPAIVSLWSGHKLTAQAWDLAFIGLHAILNLAWLVPATYLIAANQHVRISFVYLISSCVSMGLWLLGGELLPPTVGASLMMAVSELAVLIVAWCSLSGPLGNEKFIRTLATGRARA